jgi:TorA maturation chaperone TorD
VTDADLHLCRAALYTALALGFRPPTPETIERLTEPVAADALADAAGVLDGKWGTSDLGDAAAALARPGVEVAQLAADYRHLFGHTARGEVPAYETEYGDEALFQQPQELGDLAGFMQAFGLTLRPEAHERIDHVSCECEFLAFLACKHVYAVSHGDDAMLEATTRATRLFLRDHVARFAPAFARRLMRADPRGVYGALARLLLILVLTDCQRAGIAAGPEGLGLRPDPAICAAPMGCGMGAEDGGCEPPTAAE